MCQLPQAGGWTYKEMRGCTKDDKRWPVQFGSGQPAIMLSRRELCCVLPQEDPLKYLMFGMATIDDQKICPVPLTQAYPEVVDVLQSEADMCNGDGGWGVPPFEGPSPSWPAATLQLLRHIRGQKGLMQKRRFDEMEKKQEVEGAKPQGIVSG